jgi:hypothetical protein
VICFRKQGDSCPSWQTKWHLRLAVPDAIEVIS